MRRFAFAVFCTAMTFAAPALAQGATQPPTSFASMDDVDAYNAKAAYNDQIVCREEAPWTGGLLQPRNICMARTEWRKADQRMELGRDLGHFFHETG